MLSLLCKKLSNTCCGDNLHEMSDYFLGKIRKNIINLPFDSSRKLSLQETICMTCKLSVQETVCMTCQSLFFGKNKKKNTNLAIPNQISTLSMHTPSLEEIHWHLLKLSSRNDNTRWTDRHTDNQSNTLIPHHYCVTIIPLHYHMVGYKNALDSQAFFFLIDACWQLFYYFFFWLSTFLDI